MPLLTTLAVVNGVKQSNAGKDARRAQETLENTRRKQLSDEAAAREAAAERAKTTGQRVGRRSAFMSSLGFGSGNTEQGLGSGSLFGN